MCRQLEVKFGNEYVVASAKNIQSKTGFQYQIAKIQYSQPRLGHIQYARRRRGLFTPAAGNMTGFINYQSAEIHLGKTWKLS